MRTMSGIPRVFTALLVTVAAIVLAGCGGSSSVSGPGGSSGTATASLQGQVVTSQSAATGESVLVVALRTALGIGLAEAIAGSPVSGATVKLLSGGTVVATTTTDANGQFSFRDVAPGTYTIEVTWNGLTKTVTVTVGAGDQAIVGIATNGGTTLDVVAISTDVYNNDAQLGHAVNIDNASSRCDLEEVTRLRESGLGCGAIAQRCGAPPSVIGLGRSNLSDDDLDDARERTGHGRKHGSRGGGKGRG